VNWDSEATETRLSKAERAFVTANGELGRDEWLTRALCAKKAAARLFSGQTQLTFEKLSADTGEFALTAKDSHNSVKRTTVSTARDGDYIIAIAVRENHGES
jgi:hypothetical protein